MFSPSFPTASSIFGLPAVGDEFEDEKQGLALSSDLNVTDFGISYSSDNRSAR